MKAKDGAVLGVTAVAVIGVIVYTQHMTNKLQAQINELKEEITQIAKYTKLLEAKVKGDFGRLGLGNHHAGATNTQIGHIENPPHENHNQHPSGAHSGPVARSEHHHHGERHSEHPVNNRPPPVVHKVSSKPQPAVAPKAKERSFSPDSPKRGRPIKRESRAKPKAKARSPTPERSPSPEPVKAKSKRRSPTPEPSKSSRRVAAPKVTPESERGIHSQPPVEVKSGNVRFNNEPTSNRRESEKSKEEAINSGPRNPPVSSGRRDPDLGKVAAPIVVTEEGDYDPSKPTPKDQRPKPGGRKFAPKTAEPNEPVDLDKDLLGDIEKVALKKPAIDHEGRSPGESPLKIRSKNTMDRAAAMQRAREEREAAKASTVKESKKHPDDGVD